MTGELLTMGGVAGVAVACAVISCLIFCIVTCICSKKVEARDVKRAGVCCSLLVCNAGTKPNGMGLCLFWPFMLVCGGCSLIAVALSVGLVLGLLTQTKNLIVGMTVGVTLGGAALFIAVTMWIVWNSGTAFDDNLPA
ncbi:hypothetical protein Pelo_1192 [Pelomyxa schiedti]|nr:hypothetical protein Pelo_1192 [Pelomyxa schiedti]